MHSPFLDHATSFMVLLISWSRSLSSCSLLHSSCSSHDGVWGQTHVGGTSTVVWRVNRGGTALVMVMTSAPGTSLLPFFGFGLLPSQELKLVPTLWLAVASQASATLAWWWWSLVGKPWHPPQWGPGLSSLHPGSPGNPSCQNRIPSLHLSFPFSHLFRGSPSS